MIGSIRRGACTTSSGGGQSCCWRSSAKPRKLGALSDVGHGSSVRDWPLRGGQGLRVHDAVRSRPAHSLHQPLAGGDGERGRLARDRLDRAGAARYVPRRGGLRLRARACPTITTRGGPDPTARPSAIAAGSCPCRVSTACASSSAISVDISHVGRVERELAEQTSVLASIARDAPDHIMIVDRRAPHPVRQLPDPGVSRSSAGRERAESFMPASECARVFAALESVFTSGRVHLLRRAARSQGRPRVGSRTRASPIMRDGKVERAAARDLGHHRAARARADAGAREERARRARAREPPHRAQSAISTAILEAVLGELLARLRRAARVLVHAARPPRPEASSSATSRSASERPAGSAPGCPAESPYHAHLAATLDARRCAELLAPTCRTAEASHRALRTR